MEVATRRFRGKRSPDFTTVDLNFDCIYAINVIPVVIDTNVFVAAMRSEGGQSRVVIRRCLQGDWQPLFGNTLWTEYESMLDRAIWTDSTDAGERRAVMAALAASGRWVRVFYGWRPNLPDEGDNHLVELAVAGQARAIITQNLRDLAYGELKWPNLIITSPTRALEELK